MTIRLPINAVISILHRVSGIGLFLMLPLMLWGFQASIHSFESFGVLLDLMRGWFFKLVLIGFSWAFFHHFYAGLRHLGQDVHWMTSLQKARFSSRVILWLVGVSVALFAWFIW